MLCKDERILPQRVEITIGQIAPTACSPHNPVNSIYGEQCNPQLEQADSEYRPTIQVLKTINGP